MDKLEILSDIYKALSDPTRLRIVKMLMESNHMSCVNAITGKLNVTQSAISQHLRVLKQAGLVRSERKGYFVHYAINPDAFDELDELQRKVLGLNVKKKK